MEHANQNEPLSFVSLAALTARVTRYLRPDEPMKDEEPRADTDAGAEQSDNKRASAEREYVNRRLREIASFERRYRKN